MILAVSLVALATAHEAGAQTIQRRPLPAPGQPADPARDYESPVRPLPDDEAQFPDDGSSDPFLSNPNPLLDDPNDPFAQQQPPENDTIVAPDATQMDAEISEPAPAVEDKPVSNKVATFTGIDKITGRIHHFRRLYR